MQASGADSPQSNHPGDCRYRDMKVSRRQPDLDERGQPVRRVGGRLSCTLQPVLQRLHAQLIYLQLHLLLLPPAA